ncbi:Uncharacterized protein OS=Sorangium cellulosum (strain So ce56) GN=sce5710 PE=4 SV=1 [Gemmataceae bacterium]|nr:Uncharacterized protein OS=Sorangium cellulosum (strain So ce56) GN=sce5710 PE=4 SV=1 [Gemmataceae bacterium]VTT99007.1 Uncharacterized protein OS=Sorangium cellulosum (strain So ce56) GN=sce5710 PE=4 SV=1 [Gemmataceae bacterium]
MTEAEWLGSDDSRPMLEILGGREDDRKRRLFAAAAARRVGHLLPAAAGPAIEAAEAFADGRIDKSKLKTVFDAMRASANRAKTDKSAHFVVRDVARLSASQACWDVAWSAGYVGDDMPDGRDGEWRCQAVLVRDLFGNPFRDVAFSPEWRTSTVVALAQQMYEARDFSAMPILADALQDAGCDSGDVLDHCRGPGPHVRGCWVVDLVLGKE